MPPLRVSGVFFRWVSTALVLVTLLAVSACSPALNWRDVHPDQTALRVLLPCKPNSAERTVPLGGGATTLKMLSCDADGATFAVVVASLDEASRVEGALAQWQSVTLAKMQAGPVDSGQGSGSESAIVNANKSANRPEPTKFSGFRLTGAALLPPPVMIKAQGRRRDGSPVAGQAAFFAQGSQIFQVVVYAERIRPEVSETLFSSLRFD